MSERDERREEQLDAFAGAVADQRSVDWGEAAARAPELEPTLESLRTLEAIARAQQECAREWSSETASSPRPAGAYPPPTAEPSGALFAWGPLEVLEELGQGSFGKVYRAYDPALRRHVALKLRSADSGEPDAAISRWLEEARRLARVRHPNVVMVHGAAVHGGRAGLWTELLSGKTLEAGIAERGPLSPREAALVGIDLCGAISAVHAEGLVHGDVKATNVMREEPRAGQGYASGAGRVVLMDFGSMRGWSAHGGAVESPAFGTPLSTAPEALAGGAATPRTDIYSLGVLLYRLVTAQFPVRATSISELREKLASGERVLLRELRPDAPPAFIEMVERALAPDPDNRFATAGEMEGALLGFLGDRARAAALDRIESPARQRILPSARRWWAAAGALAAIAVGMMAWNQSWLPVLHHRLPVQGGKDWILVAEFDAPDSNLAVVVQDLVSTALDQSGIVASVPHDQIVAALQASGRPRNAHVDADLARELAYRRSVRAVAEGRVARLGRGYTITVRVLDVDSARVITAAAETARNEDGLIPAAERIGKKLRGNLGENRAAVQATRRLALVRTPSFEALRLYQLAESRNELRDIRDAIEFSREATHFDPELAAAWRLIGIGWRNIGDSDSSLVYLRRALSFPQRMTEDERLFTEAVIAEMEDDVAAALALMDRCMILEPHLPRYHIGRGNCLAYFGRIEESLREYRKAQEQSALVPNPIALSDEWLALLGLGRIDEAMRVSIRLTGASAREAPSMNALVASQWSRAESLGSVQLEDIAEDPDVRLDAGLIVAGARCAQGSIAAARTALDQARAVQDVAAGGDQSALREWGLMDIMAGHPQNPARRPGPRDLGEAWQCCRALRLAVAGDTLRARTALRNLHQQRKPKWSTRASQLLAEALIDSRAHRYQRVVDVLGPRARTGMYEGRALPGVMPYAMRWIVSKAWEEMGRPDSAAAYCALTLERGWFEEESYVAHAIALPFALRRLVVLDARMGRLGEARKHWRALEAQATRPDAEFRLLRAEAEQLLLAAEEGSRRDPDPGADRAGHRTRPP